MGDSLTMNDYASLNEALNKLPAGILIATGVISILLVILIIVANWKIFTKAGEAGWKSIIPILNSYVLFKIAWGNGWYFLLCCIPFVGFVFPLIAEYKLCKAFGYGVGMFLAMLFFPNIATLVLAFGQSQYQGPQ